MIIISSIYLIVIYVCVGVFMFLSLEGGGWWKFVPWHTLFAGFFFSFYFSPQTWPINGCDYSVSGGAWCSSISRQ